MITPSFSLTATERVLPSMALDFTTASLDSRVEFTRSGNTATVVNSNGYVVGINANLPRFDFNPTTLVCKGLLIEESRTNLCTYSSDYSNVICIKSNADFGLTANAATSPENTNTAFKMYETTTANVQRVLSQLSSAIVSGAVTTVSVFLKAGENSFAQVRLGNGIGTFGIIFANINISTGNITASGAAGTGAVLTGSSITSFGNGWYRVTLSGTLNADVTLAVINILMYNGTATSYAGVVNNGFYLWGAQIEAGAFATTYVPTVASQVTRNADVATMTGTNFSDWYSAGAGGIVARVLPSTVSGTRPALQFDDATANEVIALRGNTTNPELVIVDGGSPQAQIDAGTIAANTVYNLGAAWNTDNCAAAVNGGAAVTDTSATIPTVTQARLGSDGTNYLNGHFQTLRYWPQRIINAEVQAFSK
jgi:hypothetical protein